MAEKRKSPHRESPVRAEGLCASQGGRPAHITLSLRREFETRNGDYMAVAVSWIARSFGLPVR